MLSPLLLLFPSRLLCGRLKRQFLPWLFLQTHLICFKHESHFLLPTPPPVCLSRSSPTLGTRLSHLHLQEPSWKMQCPLVLPLPFQSCQHSIAILSQEYDLREVEGRFEVKGTGLYKHFAMIFFFLTISGRIQCTKAQKRGALNMKSENDTCCSLSEGICQRRLISHVH